MSSLLLPVEGDSSYRFHRPTTKKDYRPVPVRWQVVLSLHLAGKTCKEITELTGYSQAMVYRILDNKDVQYIRQQLMDQTQMEFEALFSKVTKNIREQLESKDEVVRLAAQNQWFKANGRFTPKQSKVADTITAEDIVIQILNQEK